MALAGFVGARPREQQHEINSMRAAREKYSLRGSGKWCLGSLSERVQSWQ